MRQVGSEHCDAVVSWEPAGVAVGAGQAGARALVLVAAETGRYAYDQHTDDGFVQPRALYREVMTGTGKEHLVTS